MAPPLRPTPVQKSSLRAGAIPFTLVASALRAASAVQLLTPKCDKPYKLGSSFFKDFTYLFRERGQREEERDRNIDWLPPACPQLGIEPATFHLAGQHSIHRATQERGGTISFK